MKNVGVSFGNITHFHDGLGEFSLQFGTHLAERAPTLRQAGITVFFHMPARWHGMFGPDVRYLETSAVQRALHLRRERFHIWHKLNQHIQFRAPAFTGSHIVTLHDLNLFYFKTGPSQERAKQRQLRILRQADHIVTISDYVKNDLVERLQWRGPVDRVYNGVRSLATSPQVEVPELTGEPFFLHISRMTQTKNVEAILGLAARWPERHFVLAGPRSGYTEGIESRARTAGLSNARVLYDVSDEQKAWLYQHCEAFLFPSLTEGFGLPPIEAMHFGKPVFLARRTCLPEIGGAHAFYWDNFEPSGMRQVMEDALRDPGDEHLPRSVREWAGRYNWPKCLNDYLDIYLKLLR